VRWTGNTIRNTATPSQFGGVSIRAINTDNVVIHGNSLVGTAAGIYVGADASIANSESKGVVIGHNNCYNTLAMAVASPSDNYCLRLIGAQDVTVVGNVFVNTQSGANGPTDGIKISPVAGNVNKNINIAGNRIAGFLRNQIRVDDTSSPEDITASANSFGDSAAGGANEVGGAGVANLKLYGNYSEAAGSPEFVYNQPIKSTLVTGTAPFTIASTTPVATMVVAKHPLVQFCGTTTTCSATAQTGAQTVYGSAALVSGTPSAATVTGISPAFTSSTSYVCTVTAQTAAATALLSVANVSGSSFTITGPATDTRVVNYQCTGN